MSNRIFNFSAGPAVLPEPVLRKAQEAIWNVAGSGIGIMEHSHRGKVFDRILDEAEQACRDLAGIPDNYRGAVPPGRRVAPVLDGADEPPAGGPHRRLPAHRRVGAEGGQGSQDPGRQGAHRGQQRGHQLRPDPRARRRSSTPSDPAYVHLTTNNTIYGTQWRSEPAVPAGVPLVADTSSDMYSRPIDVRKYGLIYAGAQKNLGPSGVVLVIIRDDLVEAGPKTLPTMLQYRTHRGGEVALQHAADVRDLRDGRGVQVDPGAGRARRDGRAQRGQGAPALRLSSTRATSSAAPRSPTAGR